MEKMKIKEIKQKTNDWFSSYLYKNSSESKFYNNQWSKLMDEKVQLWGRTISFTGVTTGLGSLRRNVCIENNRQFFNRLHSSVFKKKKKQIQRWVVVEYEEGRGFHSHMILEVPTHLEINKFMDIVLDCWTKTKFGKKTYIKNKVIEVCYPSERMDSKFTKEKGEFSLGYGGYTLKDFNRKTDIVDTDNSYWF